MTSPANESAVPPPQPWLLRVPAVFAEEAAGILAAAGAAPRKRLGADFHLADVADPAAVRAAPLIRWNLPVHHAWPCQPMKIDAFVEKAAQALAEKFSPREPQALLVGALDPGSPDKRFRALASNLRGRVLQLFPAAVAARRPEEQDPLRPSLFCLVGKEGLFAGMATPRDCKGFHPGGTRHIRQGGTISRAGAKIAEALHHLALHRPAPPPGSRWLELGASPGGMTAELLRRGYRVLAVDRAPLDERLSGEPELEFVRADVAGFSPDPGATFDALLCDLNGPAPQAIRHVAGLVPHLAGGGLVVFTLKAAGTETAEALVAAVDDVTGIAARAGLRVVAVTHLTYNRRELTVFFERQGDECRVMNDE